MTSGFDVFQCYDAMKRHFNSKTFDYFKYNGKTSTKYTTYEKRSDKHIFEKLSRKNNFKDILLSNFIDNNITWIGNLEEDVYFSWKIRQESILSDFPKQLNQLTSNFDDNIICKSGEYPNLLHLYKTNKVSIETLIIIDQLIPIFDYWNSKISDTILWPDIFLKFKKYSKFVKIDKSMYKNILVTHFS